MTGNTAEIDQDLLYNKFSLVGEDGRTRLNRVRESANDFRTYLRGISVESGGLALSGQYLIPLSKVNEVKERLDAMLKTREEILDQFISEYDALKEEAQGPASRTFMTKTRIQAQMISRPSMKFFINLSRIKFLMS